MLTKLNALLIVCRERAAKAANDAAVYREHGAGFEASNEDVRADVYGVIAKALNRILEKS